jgi:DNA-binding GntR family transcriptional regulator
MTFVSAPPSRQPSVPETILLYLRRLLVTGELAPGAKIPVDIIAKNCGVSAVPVREALKQLQNEGVVINEPRRGYWVARHSIEEFTEIQDITALLECEAIRLGAARLTDEDIDRMDRYRVEMEVALAHGDLWTTNITHREMHFVPYRASGKKRLVKEIERLWEHTDHYRVLYLYKDNEVQNVSLGQHADLIEACRTRDPDTIFNVMKTHRDYATATITPGLLDYAS